MSGSVVHLHVHSEYSLLDGHCQIEKKTSNGTIFPMAQRAADLGMPALGITDHGAMNGAVDHYKACKQVGIKPIIGMEAYLVDDHTKADKRGERNHLTLLAGSDEGFRNLVKLSSAGFIEGFGRGKANIDMGMLERHSAGLIALSGCLQSRLCRRIIEERPADARAHLDDLAQAIGHDNLYMEIQVNGIPEQDKANEGIVRLAREIGRPLVGTGDVHYLTRDDYHHHAALLCVQTKSTLEHPKMRFDTNEFYLKSPEEMARDFAPWPEAVPTSLEIAERCHTEIELNKLLLPRFPTPDSEAPEAMLRRLAFDGLRRRYGDPLPAEAVERLEFELGVISDMGFESYFLIVWDFVAYAKSNGVAVGPGRGSAAGSIVAYCLDITDLDPLENELLFERFLNPARKSMPDIDIDFSVRGRERVIRYVQEKYGRESVAQIITFGKMAPRAATRDAARVLGYDYATGDKLAKLIPEPIMGRSPSFEECLKPNADLRREIDASPDSKRIVDVAQGLEGVVRNNSIHAAAVVIADRPLHEIVPLQLAEDRGATALNGEGGRPERQYKIVTQYSMGPIEEIGLLKMDFLGLRNLDVIEDAVAIIKRSRDIEIDMTEIPMDDAKTFAMLTGGDSVGVFQLESDGMRDALKQVRPTEFDDIVALVSLYRPGAMRYIPDYARGKRNPSSVTYPDDRLRPITEGTYGCCIYQEQLMEISKQLGGFSPAEADDLRKAIGKKKRDLMATMKDKFLEGCASSGTQRRVADDLWGLMTAAADYSFNKCASSDTRVILPDGRRLRLSEAFREQPAEIMSMWPDGQVRPHRVAKIVKTGRKQLYRVRCESGRQIRATAEHRLMTTAGYKPISEMTIGTELITLPVISEKQRSARAETMRRLARRPHMKRMHAEHPDLTRNAVAAMHERLKWLHANDPEWRQRHMEASIAAVREVRMTGPGYGRCSIASNGMWCASRPERDMCEWLIEEGVEFEMHKVLANGRVCDFYFDGIYWEMDGMDRTAEYFAEKYGELPHVVVTPEDFKLVVADVLAKASNVENGDPIVSIEPVGEGPTYDVEMSADGPLNFIANGIVSHNSHAACYALIAYRTAYLKANYPAEYMAAVISSVMSTKDKVPFFVNRCAEMGIEVLPPDVNSSEHGFIVAGNSIRFGLDAVKNVGQGAVDVIMAGRERGGPFESIWDFAERVDARAVNKRAIECLVKCGALDSTGATRRGMLEVLPAAQASGQKAQDDALRGQGSIFDFGSSEETEDPLAGAFASQRPPVPSEEFGQRELLSLEKETLGTFLSSHPLKEVREALIERIDCSLAELEKKQDGSWVTVGGIVAEAKKVRTRSGSYVMFAKLDDLEGQVELFVPDAAGEQAAAVELDRVVVVRGRLEHKDRGVTSLRVQDAERFEPDAAEVARARKKAAPAAITLNIDAARFKAELIAELKGLFETYPGGTEVTLVMRTREGTRRLRFGDGYRVDPNHGLKAELDQLLGPRALAA